MKPKFLAAKVALVIALAAGGFSMPAQAGIPVIDGTNLVAKHHDGHRSVAQTLKQIEQYQTQLQQYENMLQNTAAPAAYIWDQAQSTINGLMNATNTLNYYKTPARQHRRLPGQVPGRGLLQVLAVLHQRRLLGRRVERHGNVQQLASESQKKANDALVQGSGKAARQPQRPMRDVATPAIGRAGATGQMQAIGYANQLASQQANQLLQIRGLLIAQQNAVATRCRQTPTRKRSRPPRRLNCARAATAPARRVAGKGFHEICARL
jgi:P-type conjugative transfer protein TrbJ